MVTKNHKLFWKMENYEIPKFWSRCHFNAWRKKKRERMKMLYKKQFRDVLETEKDTINV